ncbi:MAG TPA: hypothetical protein VH081_10420 [Solirubrobacteraceae bacterium]|nr:hypothetical protein [Solirubrobacteraceae bacterium]
MPSAVSPPRARFAQFARATRRARGRLPRLIMLLLLGLLAASLASCGSSGKGLIPTGDAGPLQSDFEAVAQAAENGDGDCTSTESALLHTEQDFARLPSSVDNGLRETLHRGIENLRTRSLALCAQPLPQSTVTTTTPKTTTSTTTTPPPSETETTTTPTTPTTTTPPGPGGGTQAPGEEGPKAGEAEGGGASPLEGAGGAVGGQEAAK